MSLYISDPVFFQVRCHNLKVSTDLFQQKEVIVWGFCLFGNGCSN